MTGASLFEAIGLLNDQYIVEADKDRRVPRLVWVRWAVAACFVVALGLTLPFVLRGVPKMTADSATPESATPDGVLSDAQVNEEAGDGYGIVGDSGGAAAGYGMQGAPEETAAHRVTYKLIDPSMQYADYTSIASDAELIVTGTVAGIVTAWEENDWVKSTLSIDVSETLKGAPLDTVDVHGVMGGVLSQLEYYEQTGKRVVVPLTEEERAFADEEAADSPDVYLNFVYAGCKNAKVGDQVLLFLTWDEAESIYRVTGSSYNGQFFIDGETGMVYRSIGDTRTMELDYGLVRTFIKNAPDTSTAHREE